MVLYEIPKNCLIFSTSVSTFVTAMSKQEKVFSGKYIEEYLQKRENIALVVLLLDIRHEPTQDDLLMYVKLINHNLSFFIFFN